MYSFNPACYLPTAVARHLPASIACVPPSFFSRAYITLTSPFTSTYAALRTVMDALISLPALSFLLLPTMTSYSTSLNLLFFYITWSTLVLSHPPLRVELIATAAVKILFYILPSLFFLGFDTLLPSAAASLKALGSTALPLGLHPTRSKTLALSKVIGWSFFNVGLTILVQLLTELLFTRVLSIRSAFRVTTTLPLPWGILRDLLRGYILREILAYTFHRYILHPPHGGATALSTYHETWYHALSTPHPISATYDHPAAYLIRSFLPAYIPAVAFRFHLITYMIYTALISMEETFAYSGYSTVPTNFILGGIARRTDNHALCGGEGNFGSWGLVDWITGTSVGGDLANDVVEELERRDVPSLVDSAVEKGKRKSLERIRKASGMNGTSGGGGGGEGRRRKR